MENKSVRTMAINYGTFSAVRLMFGLINVVYLLQNGVSIQQVAVLQAIFSFVILVFEFPTAVFADSYSRKISVVLGVMFSSLFYIFYLYPENFYMLVIGQIFYAFGLAMISGAFEGWVINELKENKNSYKKYAHLWTEIQGLGSIITGGFAILLLYFQFSYNILLLTSFVGLNICAMVFIFCKEEKTKQQITYKILLNNAKESFYILKNKAKLYILIFITFTIAIQIVFQFWQPLFIGSNISSLSFSKNNYIVLFVVYVAIFFGQFVFNYLFRSYIKEQYYFFSGIIVAIIASISVFITIVVVDSNIIIAIILYGIMHGTSSLIPIITRTYYIKRFNNTNISAIFAFLNMIARLCALVLLISISITAISGVKELFIITTIAFAVCGILIAVEFLHTKNKNIKIKSI